MESVVENSVKVNCNIICQMFWLGYDHDL